MLLFKCAHVPLSRTIFVLVALVCTLAIAQNVTSDDSDDMEMLEELTTEMENLSNETMKANVMMQKSTTTTTTTSTTTARPAQRKRNRSNPFLHTNRKNFESSPSGRRASGQNSTQLTGLEDGSIAKTPSVKPYKAPPLLKTIHDYLIVVLLVAVMFAMGCSITWSQVWSHIRRPFGVLIGMLSQFILLPFSAYLLIIGFRIDPLHATGLLILACSPGGVTSNIFAYFCEGDLSLSVTMTSFSTVVALFMMPLNVWLYGRNLETDALVIPYGKMTVSLLSLTTPVLFGMLVNWKLPRVAPILTQIGTVAGFAIIVICQTLEVFIFPDIFNDVPAVLYAAEFILPLLGLALGFGAASLFRLPYPIRRTIAIEAGIQNVGTALTIITLSFPFEQLRKVWLFPFLYAFSMLAVCCLIAIVYRVQKRLGRKKSMDVMVAYEQDYPKLQKIQQKQRQEKQEKQQQQQPQPQYQLQLQQQPQHQQLQQQQQQNYSLRKVVVSADKRHNDGMRF